MKNSLTYKIRINECKPWSDSKIENFVQILKNSAEDIHDGKFGIYLSRKVNFCGQELYFPFLDIDGRSDIDSDSKIENAISNCRFTLQSLNSLGILDRFFVVATGNTGFRIFSNMLLSLEHYRAFQEFVRAELTQVIDLAPTNDIGMPHQLFAYKGHPDQNPKELIDGHSEEICAAEILNGSLDTEKYREITSGRPDPERYISFMEKFLKFEPVSNLKELGAFGKRIENYVDLASSPIIKPFARRVLRNKSIPINIGHISKMLRENGCLNKVENRGVKIAISFRDLPCPSCGKKSSNARAYPPYYRLQCFNVNCPAHSGLSFKDWSGIRDFSIFEPKFDTQNFLPKPAEIFLPIENVEEIVQNGMAAQEDSLFLITPGGGKTHHSLKYLAENANGKTVLYSTFNKALQREAFEKFTKMSSNPPMGKLIQAREDICVKKQELDRVTLEGYSPAEILCPTCQDSTSCEYFSQKQNTGPGVYFVTHHMLRYLEKSFGNADLIVLDENLQGGLFFEVSCKETQIRSLAAVCDDQIFKPVMDILDLATKLSIHSNRTEERTIIFNGERLNPNDGLETGLMEILAEINSIPEKEVKDGIKSAIALIRTKTVSELFHKNVCIKALNWLEGLVDGSGASYMVIPGALTNNSQQGVLFGRKFVTPLGYPDSRIKILDATGNVKLIEVLTNRRPDLIQADVKCDSRRTHFRKDTSRSAMKSIKDMDLKNLLANMISRTLANNVLILTYSFLESRAKKFCREIAPEKSFEFHHFYGPRGINAFEKCDAVLVLGLPYPNILSASQDAHILFPEEADQNLRDNWADISMLNELYQGVHRIRPARKFGVEIILAANFWPSILPEPDVIEDISHEKNKAELALERILPVISEVGFFNSDIGFLCGVCKSSKKNLYDRFVLSLSQFREELLNYDMNSSLECNINLDSSGSRVSVLPGRRLEKMSGLQNLHESIQVDLIYTLYKNDPDGLAHWTPNLFPIELSTQQCADLETGYKCQFPHFKKFSMKLPNSKGHFSYGYGIHERVKEHYERMNEIGTLGKVDIDSIRFEEECENNLLNTIEENTMVVHFDMHKSNERIYIGYEGHIMRMHKNIYNTFNKIFKDNAKIDDLKIITNDYKQLIRHFDIHGYGFKFENIHDICLCEQIMKNGIYMPKSIHIKDIFSNYGLSDKYDTSLCIFQMAMVAQIQEKMIEELGMMDIWNLERRMVPIGMLMGNVGFSTFEGEIEERMEEIEGKEEISGKDRAELNNLRALLRKLNGGRIRYDVNSLKSTTGRLQNDLPSLKKKNRSFFCARPGSKLIIADYRQCEPRIAIGLSGDMKGMEILNSGKDLYREIARLVFEGMDLMDRGLNMRAIGKEMMIAQINGQGTYGFRENLRSRGIEIGQHEAEGFLQRFESHYKTLVAWKAGIISKARETGFVSTPMGRRRILRADDGDGRIVCHVVQGTASDGFKIALVDLNRGLNGLDARIVFTLHDEIIVEAADEVVEQVVEIVKGSMENAFSGILPGVPFDVEIRVRDRWGELDEENETRELEGKAA